MEVKEGGITPPFFYCSSAILFSFSMINLSAHSGHLFLPPSQFSMVLRGIPNSSLSFLCVHPRDFLASLIVMIFSFLVGGGLWPRSLKM